MAKEKDAYYLKHDTNCVSDPKMMMMLSIYQGQGYFMYWRLNEMMREQADGMLVTSGKHWYKAVAGILYSTEAELKEFIECCINDFQLYKLSPDGKLHSARVVRDMDKLEMKREQARSAGKESARQKALRMQNPNQTSILDQEPEISPKVERPLQRPLKKKSTVLKKPSTESQPFDLIRLDYTLVNNKNGIDIQKMVESFADYWSSEEFRGAWQAFINMRLFIQKPLQFDAAKLVMNKIQLYSQQDHKLAAEILMQSSIKNWADVYKLKEDAQTIRDKYKAVAQTLMQIPNSYE